MCSLDELVAKLKKAPSAEVFAAWNRWVFEGAKERWDEELQKMGWTLDDWDRACDE